MSDIEGSYDIERHFAQSEMEEHEEKMGHCQTWRGSDRNVRASTEIGGGTAREREYREGTDPKATMPASTLGMMHSWEGVRDE